MSNDSVSVCRICDEEFRRITNTHVMLHGITLAEYRDRFRLPARVRRPDRTRRQQVKDAIRAQLGHYLSRYADRRRAGVRPSPAGGIS